jgi:hypothetical protein
MVLVLRPIAEVEADLLDGRQAGHGVAGDPAAGEGIGRVQERVAPRDELPWIQAEALARRASWSQRSRRTPLLLVVVAAAT